MARLKLTKSLLEKMNPGDLVRDADVKGLFAERGKAGDVSLKIQGDLRQGPRNGAARKPTSIRMTLGRFPEISIDAARARAQQLLGAIRAGNDPRPKAVAAVTEWTIEHAYAAYARNAAKRPGSERTVQDMQVRLTRYLSDWKQRPLTFLTRELCEQRQCDIAAAIKARAADENSKTSRRATGARAANATIKDLAAVWGYAADYITLGANPAAKVTLIGEVKAHHEIDPRDLRAWLVKVRALTNPVRRAMHEFGLYSGLRPGNLMGIERSWIRLEDRRVVFPASVMKGRRQFVLPLSSRMVELVNQALAAGNVMSPGTQWLFPGRAGGATTVIREKTLPNATGHALRHTWKTCARRARLPEVSIELLLAHRLGGMIDTYGSIEHQFDRLVEDQETVTAFIRSCAEPAPAAPPA